MVGHEAAKFGKGLFQIVGIGVSASRQVFKVGNKVLFDFQYGEEVIASPDKMGVLLQRGVQLAYGTFYEIDIFQSFFSENEGIDIELQSVAKNPYIGFQVKDVVFIVYFLFHKPSLH